MPKVSKETADKSQDYGVVEEQASDLEGYTVNFVTFKESVDHAPMLASLPGGHCSCPHWGYVLGGRFTVRYGDHEDVLEAGDAFYLTPGHVPVADAGTEIVLFSPAEELAATDAAIMQAMQRS